MHPSSKRIMSLEALRVAMMFLIFLSHLDCFGVFPFYSAHLYNIGACVDYFFILSGFGAGLQYFKSSLEPAVLHPVQEFKKSALKLKNIYPVYIVSLLLVFPRVLWLSCHVNPVKTALLKVSGKFLICLTLMQSFSGVEYVSHCFNVVGWFLSSIFWVYVFSPYVFAIIQKFSGTCQRKPLIPLVFSLFLSTLVFTGFYEIEQRTAFNSLSFASPFSRVTQFLIGIFLASLYLKFSSARRQQTDLTWLEILTVFLFFCWFAEESSLPWPAAIKYFMDILITSASLLVFALDRGKISRLLSRSLSRFSPYVMYFFLLHFPVKLYMDDIFEAITWTCGDFLRGVFETSLILAFSFLLIWIYCTAEKKFTGIRTQL